MSKLSVFVLYVIKVSKGISVFDMRGILLDVKLKEPGLQVRLFQFPKGGEENSTVAPPVMEYLTQTLRHPNEYATLCMSLF
jgi:hypothetical protein